MSIWRGWEVLQVWSPSKRRVGYERMRVDLKHCEAVENTCGRTQGPLCGSGQLLNCLVISLLSLKHVEFHQKVRWLCVIDFMFLRNTRTLNVWNAFSVFKNLLGITLILIITSDICGPWDFGALSSSKNSFWIGWERFMRKERGGCSTSFFPPIFLTYLEDCWKRDFVNLPLFVA